MRIIVALLIFTGLSAKADIDNIIAQSNRTVWVKGWTVGSQSSPTWSSVNVSNVHFHGADTNGVTNAATVLDTVADNMPAFGVMYLPNGVYALSNSWTIDRNDIRIVGESTNAVIALLGGTPGPTITIGHDLIGTSQADYFFATNVNKGDTNISLYYNTNLFGTVIAPGDTFQLSGLIDIPTNASPHWSFYGTTSWSNMQYDFLYENVCVHTVSGTNITIKAPTRFPWTNSVRLRGMGLMDARSQFNVKTNVEFSNITITTTNGGRNSQPAFMLKLSMLRDCVVSNVNVWYSENYNVSMADCLNVTIEHCDIGLGQDGDVFVSNHAGLLSVNSTGILVENTIFRSTFPPWEWNNAYTGCAAFGNYFPSNFTSVGFWDHGPHPLMNLWEQNDVEDMAIKFDGYFGSISHQTIFRNRFWFHDAKRWTTHHQIVGNVIGQSFNTTYTFDDLFQRGLPNIGNTSFYGDAPPAAWNWPGPGMDGSAGGMTNVGVVLTATVSAATIAGDFAHFGTGSSYPLVFQDVNNTNEYFWLSSIAAPATAMTPAISSLPNVYPLTVSSTDMTMSRSIVTSNGWKVYMGGPGAFQSRQYSDLTNCVVHGNLLYTNVGGTLQWDPGIADHDLPDSILYASGVPAWWGTNRWPAIDSEGSPFVTPIPAYDRYHGIEPPPPGPGAPTVGGGISRIILSR